MEIRRARAADAASVAEVFIASFETLDFLPRLHTHAEHRAFVRDVVLPRLETWVAEEDGCVVGFVALSTARVEHLYVDPPAHRRGVGTALLDVAKARRPRGFSLWVFQQNTPARRFYETRGLRLVELTDGAGNAERTPDARYEWTG